MVMSPLIRRVVVTMAVLVVFYVGSAGFKKSMEHHLRHEKVSSESSSQNDALEDRSKEYNATIAKFQDQIHAILMTTDMP